MDFKIENITVPQKVSLITGIVSPRPIALVSTVSKDGIPNIAPYSFYTIACFDPVMISFFVVRGKHYKYKTEPRDTYQNIIDTKEFVVNIAVEPLMLQINEASATLDADVNEFETTNLTPAVSNRVNVPGILESPVRMECKLEKVIGFGDKNERGSDGIFGRVVHIYAEDSIVNDYNVDEKKLKPLSHVGGLKYSTPGNTFEMDRPEFLL